MARKISPFAELTNEQKQLKWLEYQSIRLPYTEAEPMPEAECKPTMTQSQTEARTTPAPIETAKAQPATGHSRPMPPPEVFVESRMQQQKTRHHQYDAVIARMKQAEMRTGSYHSWSK